MLAISTPDATCRVNHLHDQVKVRECIFQPTWCKGRTVLDDPEVAALPLAVRKSKAVEYVLTAMPISIDEGELIVGKVLPEGHVHGFSLPNYAAEEEIKSAAAQGHSIYSVFGHNAPGFQQLLNMGIAGIMAKIERRLAEVKTEPTGAERARKEATLQSFAVVGRALVKLANRYADLAEEMAKQTIDASRAAELREIAAICRRVPEHPARSFQEAIQSTWFLHVALHSTISRSSVGRLDQFLWPYYQEDLTKGTLTKEDAQELIDCLWIKLGERDTNNREILEQILDKEAIDKALLQGYGPKLGVQTRMFYLMTATEKMDGVNSFFHNVVLGGQTPDGQDATNDLTYMCLNSTHRLELVNPLLNLRIHKGTPPELMRRVAEMLRAGGGTPTIYNDEIIIPGLLKIGISTEDARNYCNDGCWEPVLPGQFEFRFTCLNLLHFLEWTLNHGRSFLTEKQEVADPGDPTACRSYNEFFEMYQKVLERIISSTIDTVTQHYGTAGEIAPDPLMSITVDDCVEKARDFTKGGAKYITFGFVAGGASHTIDSLVAIKRIVFEERKMPMADLVNVLRENFAGQEALRQYLQQHLPKYGNNDDYADDITVQLMNTFTSTVRRLGAHHPWIKFTVSIGTFPWMLPFGRVVGATADGRLAGTAVSSNFSPSVGADVNGPAADIRSYTKPDLSDFVCGAPLDLKISSDTFRGDAGIDRLVALLESFRDLGGNILTLTVCDVETLKAAQREPEKHRNLRIRVGGWNAFFTSLSKESQDYQIARMQYKL